MTQEKSKIPPRGAASRSLKQNKAPKKSKKKRSILLPIMFVLLGLFVTIALYLGYLALKTIDAIDSIGIEDKDVIIETTAVPAEESVKEKPVAFVLMGLDSRQNGGGLNTDVMMVATFNPDTKKSTIVTIPRDTYIDVDGYKGRKANGIYADFYMNAKSNGLETAAAQLEGKKVVREVLGKLFGIDIKYAAMINFKGFEDIVDVLGGVKVNVDMRMLYTDNADGTHIDLQKGVQVLHGEDALDFVRYRKSNDGTNMSSDFDRNRRQSEVISAILDKMMTLGGMTKLGAVIEAVGDNVSMDMQSSEIKKMLGEYRSLRSDDITFLSLDGTWRSPYVYADEASLQVAREALQAQMAQ